MRVRLQESIELQKQYEENRKELLTSISHDLRTPLTAIQGYVDGILEGVANSPEKTERYMRTISAKTADMSHLIDELFLYSKLDLGRIPFQLERVPLRDFVMDWAEELEFELDKQGATLRSELDAPPQWILSIDRDKFKRVLVNIIQNSIKYGDKSETLISLRADVQGGTAVIEIEDNGPGIPAASLPHIFDRFYRSEPSRNTGTGGSGLGLAIAKQIMEGHGGSIAASSQQGHGTCIRLTLPVAAAGQEEEEPT